MPRLSSRSASLATVRHLHPRGSLKKRAIKSTSLRYRAPLNHAPRNHGPPSHGPTNNESNAHVTHRLGVRWIKRPRHQTRHQTRHESRHESRPTRARAACAPRDPPEEGASPSPPLSRSPPFGLADVAEKSPPDASDTSDTSDARPDGNAWSSSGNLGKPWEALGSLGKPWESAGISGKQRETLRWTQPSPARGASHVA